MKKICVLLLGLSVFLAACNANEQSTTVKAETTNEQLITVEAETVETMGEYQTREILSKRDELSIYGQAYIPGEGKGKYPTIIIGHGFTGTYRDNAHYAEYLAANGIVAYVFDFVGGSNSTQSDGDTRDMSVLTEVEDMKAVLEHFKTLDFVDPEHIFLMGESQGGFVAALTAAQKKDEIKGLIMLYPAFIIPDDAKATYASPSNIPNDISLWGVHVSAKYYTDLWDMDVYKEIGLFTGDVLIFHGTQDNLVNLSYSERAVEVYQRAELVVYEGAGHGFYGSPAQQASEKMVEFINKNTRAANR